MVPWNCPGRKTRSLAFLHYPSKQSVRRHHPVPTTASIWLCCETVPRPTREWESETDRTHPRHGRWRRRSHRIRITTHNGPHFTTTDSASFLQHHRRFHSCYRLFTIKSKGKTRRGDEIKIFELNGDWVHSELLGPVHHRVSCNHRDRRRFGALLSS